MTSNKILPRYEGHLFSTSEMRKWVWGIHRRRWYYPSLVPHIFAKTLSIHLRFFEEVSQEPEDSGHIFSNMIAFVQLYENSTEEKNIVFSLGLFSDVFRSHSL